MENEVRKKRILSGIQPSGDLTLGSYLGAIKNWAALADEYDCYYMLADMHTITVRQVPAELRRHTLTQVAAYIASGLDPERSLELVGSLNDDPDFQKKLENCKERLAGSEELSTALTASGIFSGMYSRMIAIGGRTGSMDQVMKQIADLYQDEMDDKMNRAIAVLEPTLVIALSLVVGVILLSVMLPLMGILSSL